MRREPLARILHHANNEQLKLVERSPGHVERTVVAGGLGPARQAARADPAALLRD